MNKSLDHPQVKIHARVLTLINGIAAFGLQWLFPLPFPVPRFLQVIGILIILAGLVLNFPANRQFDAANTTLDPHGSVRTVVTSGPYRFSRNPIYLGFVCVWAGLLLAAERSYWGILLSPVFVLLFNQLVIRYEEAYLEKKFGGMYTSYKSSVRRWL